MKCICNRKQAPNIFFEMPLLPLKVVSRVTNWGHLWWSDSERYISTGKRCEECRKWWVYRYRKLMIVLMKLSVKI